MTRQAFRVLVEEAIDTIPRRFADQVRNLAVVIEDEPTPDVLADVGVEPPDRLLGLYQGTPLTDRGWGYGNTLPDRITLFQRTIEDECEGDEDEIVVAIGETLIHELGHYFGLSEDEIMAIEDQYWHDQGFTTDDADRDDADGTSAADDADDADRSRAADDADDADRSRAADGADDADRAGAAEKRKNR